MSDLKLQWMADELHDAGLKVIEHSGWKTRSVDKPYSYKPVGVLDHHTAGSSILGNYPNPPFYPFTSLHYKCNITIQPDGYVVCLNAGIANDSGMGDPAVLNRLLRDEPVGTPQDFSADDRITGNPWFIDIEVQHLGNGDPIVPVQRDALIRTNAVLLDHYGWDASSRLLGHREWTRRKIDPRWDGFSNPMPQIRADTKEVTNMPLSQDDLNNIAAIVDSRIKAHTEDNWTRYAVRDTAGNLVGIRQALQFIYRKLEKDETVTLDEAAVAAQILSQVRLVQES